MDFDELKNKAKDLISSVTEGSTERHDDPDQNLVGDSQDQPGGYTNRTGASDRGDYRDPAGAGYGGQPGSLGEQGVLRDPAGGGYSEQPGFFGEQGGVDRGVNQSPPGGYQDPVDAGFAEQPGSFDDQSGVYQSPPGSYVDYSEGSRDDREGR